MPTLTDKQQAVSDEEKARFVMSHVADSDRMREEYIDRLREQLENYLVKPFGDNRAADRLAPLAQTPVNLRQHGRFSRWTSLKDSESNQIVETLLSAVMSALVGEAGFVQTRRRGFEDTFKSSAVSRLLEYNFELEGQYRTLYQWLKDGFIFGTGIVLNAWEYEEAPGVDTEIIRFGTQSVRQDTIDPAKVVRDDPYMTNIDILDFYPASGDTRLCRMRGAAHRFTMNARAAVNAANNRPHWKKGAVREAILRGGESDARDAKDWNEFEGLDRPSRRYSHPDFLSLVGYEYWGEVPWKVPAGQDSWQVLTVLGGRLVAERTEWPRRNRRLPYFDFTVNPMAKRFYGVAPLEVVRYSQDLADVILSNIADGIVKSIHHPWLIDRNARVDTEKLEEFHPDTPIYTDMMNGVQPLEFQPNIGEAMGVLQIQKQSMRERTGANNVQQGIGFSGVPRTASAAAIEARQSAIRPETIAQYIERDTFPPIAKDTLTLYQQFLPPDDDEIRLRIGELPEPVFIEEVMADYDVKFIGSRQNHDRETRLRSLIEVGAVAGQSPVFQLFPWMEWMVRVLRAADLHELEAFVADPTAVQVHSLLAQIARGGAGQAQTGLNQNGAPRALAPSGLPEQLAGRTVG